MSSKFLICGEKAALKAVLPASSLLYFIFSSFNNSLFNVSSTPWLVKYSFVERPEVVILVCSPVRFVSVFSAELIIMLVFKTSEFLLKLSHWLVSLDLPICIKPKAPKPRRSEVR